jgi:hypothetical protein
LIRISTARPPLAGVFGPLDEEGTSPGVLLAPSNRLGSGHIVGWVGDGAPLEVSVELELRSDTARLAAGRPWRVGIDAWDLDGELRLHGDENRVRAGDVVVQIPEHRMHRPGDAARAVADVCARLAGAARSRPPDAASWQPRRR